MMEEATHVGRFTPTQWTLVARARDDEPSVAEPAREELFKTYWHPVYAFIRSSGRTPHDAQDLTQAFFLQKVHEGDLFGKAAKEKGRLRTLLLSALQNFLKSEWSKVHAAKRGGHALHFSIDEANAEGWYGCEPVEGMTPDRIYQRRWAMSVLDATMQELSAEHARKGKAALFEALKPWIGVQGSDMGDEHHQAAAEALGMSPGALRTAVFRLRQRYQEKLRRQVAQTLEKPTDEAIKEELMELMNCV